jgi:hypothetical protein
VLVHGAAGAVGQALLALGRLAGLDRREPGTARRQRDWVHDFRIQHERIGERAAPSVNCDSGEKAQAHENA